MKCFLKELRIKQYKYVFHCDSQGFIHLTKKKPSVSF